MTSPAGEDSAERRTSLRRVVGAAAGGAVVTWLLWRFAFGDSTGRSTVQAAAMFALTTAVVGHDRWSTRRRRG